MVVSISLLFLLSVPSVSAQTYQYLYVADSGAKVVHKLTPEGTYIKAVGSGILTAPVNCIFDSKGNLIVVDGSNLKVFQNDTYLSTFGQGYFASDTRFATVDGAGNIYVSNHNAGVVEVFDANYQHKTTLDFKSVLGGSYEGPMGISYDAHSGNLIFATLWASSGTDHGLFEIKTDGSIVREFGLGWYSHYNCLTTPAGTAFVTDMTSGIKGIRVYDASRNQIKIWLQNQLANSSSGYGLGIDPLGKIYVTIDATTIKVYESYNTETPLKTITSSNFVNCLGLAIGTSTIAEISFREFQSIPTSGATEWKSFIINSETYLAVANQDNGSSVYINSKIYKWNGSSFLEFQSIPTVGATALESFVIDGINFLAVGNYWNGSTRNIDSKIYRWNGSSFTEFQSIPTNAESGFKSFVIDGQTYLAIANQWDDSNDNLQSKIYKWNGSSFVEYQSILTTGAHGWESFVINGEKYLAVANYSNHSSYNANSKIYKWNGTSFAEVQSIPTMGSTDCHSFMINGETYLAFSNFYNGSYNLNSKIYKWNGAAFSEFQSIPTTGGFKFESFVIDGENYLAIANYGSSTSQVSINSKIYKWNGSSFVEFQSIQTIGAVDWHSFVVAGDRYLAVANYYNGSNYNIDSKIYKWSSTDTNYPPNTPSSPSPSAGAVNVINTTTLSWTGGDPDVGNTVTYDIYFGTTSTPSKS